MLRLKILSIIIRIYRYELVLVARDHGSPVAFETLRFVTVVVADVNDNGPEFEIDGDEEERYKC